VVLIDPLDFEKPATRNLVKYLEGIGVEGKALLLTHGLNHNVVLSARNVPDILVRPFGEESTYDILWSATVLIERPAVEASREEKMTGTVASAPLSAASGSEVPPTESEEVGDA
jgi:large subunit ribosomal protein L4